LQSLNNVGHGIKDDNNVLKALTGEEKTIFYECVKERIKINTFKLQSKNQKQNP